MSKRKYRPGKKVTSVEEIFMYQWFIFDTGFQRKTYHSGWLGSLQARVLYTYIQRGQLFIAEKIGE